MANKTRESKGTIRARQKEVKSLEKDAGLSPDGPIHVRMELESSEFVHTFVIDGGRENLGGEIVANAFDVNGRKVRQGPMSDIPSMLGQDRGKWAQIAARWKDVEAIQYVKELLRNRKARRRKLALSDAHEKGRMGFIRQDVPDQEQRSIFLGSNQGVDPNEASLNALVVHRLENGRYGPHLESWDGQWSAPDENGIRHRIDVKTDRLWHTGKGMEMTFHDRDEAEQALTFAIEEGAKLHFESGLKLGLDDLRRGDKLHKMAKKLNKWEKLQKDNDGNYVMTDMKSIHAPQPEEEELGVWKQSN